MASPNSSIKIHEHCHVAPPPESSTHLSLLLTLFDLIYLRFSQVECLLFYSFPSPHTNPSFFFEKVVPRLKTSLSLTLQNYLPLAGNIVWPSDSETPIIQYKPGDDEGVSLVIAESDADFNHILDNSSLHELSESGSFVPHLETSHSHASLISLQVTLIQNSGFCIGFAGHHAFLDGKSIIMFLKAWASICSSESPSLVRELVPFLDREAIMDAFGLDLFYKHNEGRRSLKISQFQPKVEHSFRATFELTRTDLEKLKKKVLSKWDTVMVEGEQESIPHAISSFIVACACVFVCLAKAIKGVEKERKKFTFSFMEDRRPRLKTLIPGNYFGSCIWGHFLDGQPMDYTMDDGLIIAAKKIYNKIKMLDKGFQEEGHNDGNRSYAAGEVPESILAIEAIDTEEREGNNKDKATYAREVLKRGFCWRGSGSDNDWIGKVMGFLREGVDMIFVSGSNRFGFYDIDFGWGRPSKAEIPSVDRGLAFAIIESNEGNGGIEVGIVQKKHVLDLFKTFLYESIDGI